MTDHIQIGAVEPRHQYRASGTDKAFTFSFPIFTAADMEVWLDNTRQTSGFQVSGAGTSIGGSVILDTPPAAGTRVTLRRRLAIQRTTDYQADAVIRAKVLNDDLDYQVAALQQVADDVSLTLHQAPTSGSTADLTLPEPAAGMALKWNADGSGLANSIMDVDAVNAAASTSAGQAATSATSAASSATTATTSATTATTAAGIATAEASAASSSASQAATSATNAATSASQAATSAATASTAEAAMQSAYGSIQAVQTAAAQSAASASAAHGSETNAASSASSAAISATAAATSAASVGNAASTATTAAAQASSSATAAAGSAGQAATSETNAAASAAQAATAASSAAAGASAAQVAKVTWRGPWDNATAYTARDAVSFGGSSWIATQAGTSRQPDASPTYWDLLAAKGSAGTGTGDMLAANNLSDVVSAAAARGNLGLAAVAASGAYSDLSGKPTLGTAAAQPVGTFCQVANNLSDVTAATARTNLGLATVAASGAYSDLSGKPSLGTAAAQNVGAFCQVANNLSDVTAATARSNLGLVIGTNVLAPSGDGSQLTNLPNTTDSDCRATVLQNWLADAVNGGWQAGGFVAKDGGWDTFVTDTIGANSTNQSYDGTNHIYANPGIPSTSYANAGGTGDRTASITVTKSGSSWYSTSNGSLLVNGNNADNNNNNLIANGQSVAGIYVTFDFGVGASKVINEVTIYTNSASEGTWKWQGSNDNSTYTDIGTSFSLTGTNPVITSVSGNITGYRYYRMMGVSGTGTSTWLQEFTFKIGAVGTPANMTLVSNAMTVASAPSLAQVIVAWNPVDSCTLNTDLTLEVTKDGTTWTAFTLADSGTTLNGFKVLTASGVPGGSGTSVRYRLKTLNTKSQQVRGVALMTR